MSDVRVDGTEVTEGIQLGDERAVRRQEHQIQRILPILRERPGKRISVFGQPVGVVNQDPRTDKRVVDSVNDVRFGEQTCSQIGAAGSTTLLVESAP